MHISWLGTTAIKLQTKHQGNDVTIVIDPYKPAKGSFPRSLAPNIGIYTRSEKNSVTLSGKPFIFATAGECETDGVLMTAADGRDPNHTVVRIDAEQMSIGHLGLLDQLPPKAAVDMLSGVDILFVPVGAKEGLTPELAMKAVNIIEPRVVIPMAFTSDNDPKAEGAEGFLKEIGAKVEPEKKVIIKKKDLPQEETHVILLEKE